MKTKLLLLSGIIAALGSCTSAYRIGQTPDDVYYSPAPPAREEYVSTNNQQDQESYGYNNPNIEDLAIRRGINDPMYRSGFSLSMGYGYNPYDYYGSSFYSPYASLYNPYSSFLNPYYSPYSYPLVTFNPYNYYNYNSFYSPYNNYYYPYIIKSGNASANYNVSPRRYNLGAYNVNRAYRPASQPSNNANSVPARTFTTQPVGNNRSGGGGLIRRIFTPSNNRTSTNNNYTPPARNNTNNNYTPPARTFEPSSSGSSSSGSSGGGSAPVRTFRK